MSKRTKLSNVDEIDSVKRLRTNSDAQSQDSEKLPIILYCQPIDDPDKWTFAGHRSASSPGHVKLVTWNVNSLRSLLRDYPNLLENYVRAEDPDVLCLQEIKLDSCSIPLSKKSTPFKKVGLLEDKGYKAYYNCSTSKKGYAGTAMYIKTESPLGMPLKVQKGLPGDGLEEANAEGRVITVEFDKLWLVNTYVPNSGAGTSSEDGKNEGLGRLEYRLKVWEPAMRAYLAKLRNTKPVIFCGDLNVSYADIDIHSPQINQKSAGFTPEERAAFGALLADGWVDAYRHLHPDQVGMYTYWGYRTSARSVNKGWRLDYFLLSADLAPALLEVSIRGEIGGSDHCPVACTLTLDPSLTSCELQSPATDAFQTH